MARIGLLLLAVIASPVLLGAIADPAIPRVRPFSERATRLVDIAKAVSPTIAAMLAKVDRSDIILQIELTMAWDVKHAVTRLVTATPDFRYVRVSINPRNSPLRKLELLGHELQHVLEIAADRTVRDQEAMRRYFERIGEWNSVTGSFETEAAADVESVIRTEARGAGRSLSALRLPDPSPDLL